MKKLLVIFVFCIFLSCVGLITSDINNESPGIVSPYNNIDWQNYGQYIAALHVHTTNSDGRNTLNEVIEAHYTKGFDILAITDHNVLTADWLSARNGLEQERFNAIANGESRDGRVMLQIPLTNEQSVSDHINTFFADYNNSTVTTLRTKLRTVERLGGISFINHPGRYTNGKIGGRAGEDASNNEQNITKYVNLFMEFPSCVGMEIINNKDYDSKSDRILWDNILAQTIPQGRFVWGFSNDDSHRNENIGYSFNVFVMPENTPENFRYAMLSGSFFAVARVARRELGDSFEGTGPTPAIVNIEIDDKEFSITITAENYSRILWISNGNVIAEGNSVNLMLQREYVGSYVRANIIGSGGIVFTQPFGIVW